VKERSGPGAAKTTKTALNGMFVYANEFDAMRSNPARDAIKIGGAPRHTVRALTVDEVEDLTDRLRSDDTAIVYDLPDLVDFMLATGCRIGEACAVGHANCPRQHPHQSLDLDAGTVEIDSTLVRVKGRGVTVQHRTKTDAGWRVLALPSFAVDMLKRRDAELRLQAPFGVVFGSPRARALRDPSNTAGDLRAVLDRLGYEWVTGHTFRKTVATRMDEAGRSPREIADQLGHKKASMTLDTYMGRNVVSAAAAKILDR
jgi:integrase